MHAPLARIARHLRARQPPGHFATQHELSALGLELEVDGVGPLRLPLTEDRVTALLAQARPSPFGCRDETRSDPSVRDAWEIPGVVVSHGGQELVFDTARSGLCLSLLGFYVDCVHEIRPVRSGHRVALTFTLDVDGAVPLASGDPTGGLQASLQDSLAWDEEEDPEAPWLVSLLEHQYSHQGIGWDRLKNGDRARAEALRRLAPELDCHCLLALANTEETYAYHGEEGGFEDDDDEAPEPVAGRPEATGLGEDLHWPDDGPSWADDRLPIEGSVDPDPDIGSLQERTVTLIHGVDTEGRACTVPDAEFFDDCVLSTVETPSWRSYESQVEPWTGNEGGVAAKWFHLYAVVLVPRAAGWAPEPVESEKPGPVRRRFVRR